MLRNVCLLFPRASCSSHSSGVRPGGLTGSVQRVTKLSQIQILAYKLGTILFLLLRELTYISRDLCTLGRSNFFPLVWQVTGRQHVIYINSQIHNFQVPLL